MEMARKKEGCSACPLLSPFVRLRDSEPAKHFRKARREILLGIRSILDEIIEAMEEGEKGKKEQIKKVKIS